MVVKESLVTWVSRTWAYEFILFVHHLIFTNGLIKSEVSTYHLPCMVRTWINGTLGMNTPFLLMVHYDDNIFHLRQFHTCYQKRYPAARGKYHIFHNEALALMPSRRNLILTRITKHWAVLKLRKNSAGSRISKQIEDINYWTLAHLT